MRLLLPLFVTLAGCGPDRGSPATPSTPTSSVPGTGPSTPSVPTTTPTTTPVAPLRIATFNTALSLDGDGALLAELRAGSRRGRQVAEVLQQVRPDVVLLQEVDFEDGGALLDVLHDDYLAVAQGDLEPLDYPYRVHIPSNTGVPSGVDLDNDGASDGPGDAQGFGLHPGHYAFAVLSRHPLGEVRAWQELLWADMPDHRMPTAFYSPAAQAVLRLSSKSHVVVPVHGPTGTVSLVASHPTPPVFDGPEDRNGLRNHDEIALLGAILSDASWLVDDDGGTGGLAADASFVVLGDLNADPFDGEALRGGILALLDHPRVNPSAASGDAVPASEGGVAHDPEPGHRGDPANDTTSWGLRVDYALPSSDLVLEGSGVFWPEAAGPEAVSDHRLVWVDVAW